MEYEEIKNILRQKIVNQIDLSRDTKDSEIQELIDQSILSTAREYRLSLAQKTRLSKELFYAIRRLDILEELTDDPSITEIMINGENIIYHSQLI